MMKLPDLFRRRRWTVNGYHAYPITDKDKDLPVFQQWVQFDALLREAKHGNFARIHNLVAWLADVDDWVLEGEYIQLLGDAGSSNTLRKVMKTLTVGQDIVSEFGFGQILEYWGHLSAIPVLIDLYERYSFSEDSWYIPPGLSRLMEDNPGDIHWFPMNGSDSDVNDYSNMVRRRYEELCNRLGTEDAFVFRGEIIEIRNVCNRMLGDLKQRNQFHEEMRHKFESFTGIDCSGFYQQEVLQPLRVAGIIEEFLASPEADKYEPGVRYFWGHRIPEE